MVWQGICGGAEGFAEIIDCTGFSNVLIILSMLGQTIYGVFNVLVLLLQLVFAALQESLCADIECSNICSTPTCSNWGETKLEFIR